MNDNSLNELFKRNPIYARAISQGVADFVSEAVGAFSNSTSFKSEFVHTDINTCRTISVDLPGFSIDDVKLELVDNILHLNASTDNLQVSHKTFSKRYRINESVKFSDASMRDGLLTLKFEPSNVKSRSSEIKIKS